MRIVRVSWGKNRLLIAPHGDSCTRGEQKMWNVAVQHSSELHAVLAAVYVVCHVEDNETKLECMGF
jgi:hypothetical protein